MPKQINDFAAAATLVVVFYLAAASLIPLPVLDALYFPDDTYYTLSIARNIAAGNGPSTDGIIQTTGFQPLIALLMQPVFWLGMDGDAALRAVVVLSASFGAAAVITAAAIVRQATQSIWAAVWTLVLAGVSPMIFLNAMNGLETTLAGLLGLLLIWGGANTTAASSNRWLVCLGVLAGIALWARIDTALVILVLVPVALWRLGLWRTFLVAGVAALTVAPWVAYCVIAGGEFIPESGGAVRQIVAYMFERRSMTYWSTFYMALIPAPGALFPLFGENLSAALSLLLIVPPLLAIRRGKVDAPAILSVAALVLIVFYGFGLPAFWFYHRYLFLAEIAFVVAVVIGLWALTQRWEASTIRQMTNVLLIAVMLGQALTYLPAINVIAGNSEGFNSGHAYGKAAAELLPSVPDGSVLTAMQSGALNWFAPDGVRVVNLDGVVNGSAKDAIHNQNLDQYMQSIGATHFADWASMADWMQLVSTAPVPLTKIAASIDHAAPGFDFTLYRIDWP